MSSRPLPRSPAVALVALIAIGCRDDEPLVTDTTPPVAIGDLRASQLDPSTILLTWTAPGDDGTNGRAAAYDVRRATQEITLASWAGATPIDSVPAPRAAGAAESLLVRGLSDGLRHYFAVRTADEASWSSLSNATQLTTFPVARSEPELIRALRDAYRDRAYDRYSWLFPNDPSAPFLFYLADPPGAFWDRAEELRIHRRMFQPENQQPPVPEERWLVSIDIQLTQTGDFTEQPIYYGPPVNQQPGLDPARWKATESVYGTYVFFQTQGETHYQVNGRASFVVIEDLAKQSGDAGKYSLYRWFDLGIDLGVDASESLVAVSASTWSSVKVLYR